ncbi:MAG TPA: BamA/TamA family outer membrane protein [Gammaproteobacteria bacterium]|nr:BamA/TamA family outer membrane protein [Gammaproteobacteria bacterium]
MKNSRILITALIGLISLSASAENPLKLEITGITGAAEKNIESQLDVASILDHSQENIAQFYTEAPNEIQTALQPFGYFKANIKPTGLVYKNNQWIMKFHVTPGPRLLISDLDIKISGDAANDLMFKKILANFPVRRNQAFSINRYHDAKKNLLNTALAQGYFDAKITTQQIIINLQQYTARIVLHFDSGIHYKFGDIFFNDNPYASNFLKRYAPFTSNEYYSAAKIQDFQQALSSSDYFKEVMIDPDEEHKTATTVPINVHVMPLPAKQYSLGLGYGTDTGPRALVNYELRRITPYGQRFKAQLEASPILTNLQANYYIPGKNPATEKYVFTAATQQEFFPLGKGNLAKIAASYVSTMNKWQRIISLTLQRENWTLQNQPYQTQYMLIPSINWQRTSQDNPLHPSRGYRINFGALASPGIFGSAAFVQTQFNAKAIYPILEKNRLVTRINLGYTAINHINQMPLSLQFLAGGSDSIRGYKFNSIGPGSKLAVGSVEYRQHIKGDWYGAAFFDAGNVSNGILNKVNKGVGLGALWQSPVGTLALTLAKALDLPGQPLAVQFSMGADL